MITKAPAPAASLLEQGPSAFRPPRDDRVPCFVGSFVGSHVRHLWTRATSRRAADRRRVPRSPAIGEETATAHFLRSAAPREPDVATAAPEREPLEPVRGAAAGARCGGRRPARRIALRTLPRHARPTGTDPVMDPCPLVCSEPEERRPRPGVGADVVPDVTPRRPASGASGGRRGRGRRCPCRAAGPSRAPEPRSADPGSS